MNALARVLPRGFAPTEEPTIQVNYQPLWAFDYMAGRVTVLWSLISGQFFFSMGRGWTILEGWFGLVLWMNKFHANGIWA